MLFVPEGVRQHTLEKAKLEGVKLGDFHILNLRGKTLAMLGTKKWPDEGKTPVAPCFAETHISQQSDWRLDMIPVEVMLRSSRISGQCPSGEGMQHASPHTPALSLVANFGGARRRLASLAHRVGRPIWRISTG